MIDKTVSSWILCWTAHFLLYIVIYPSMSFRRFIFDDIYFLWAFKKISIIRHEFDHHGSQRLFLPRMRILFRYLKRREHQHFLLGAVDLLREQLPLGLLVNHVDAHRVGLRIQVVEGVEFEFQPERVEFADTLLHDRQGRVQPADVHSRPLDQALRLDQLHPHLRWDRRRTLRQGLRQPAVQRLEAHSTVISIEGAGAAEAGRVVVPLPCAGVLEICKCKFTECALTQYRKNNCDVVDNYNKYTINILYLSYNNFHHRIERQQMKNDNLFYREIFKYVHIKRYMLFIQT